MEVSPRADRLGLGPRALHGDLHPLAGFSVAYHIVLRHVAEEGSPVDFAADVRGQTQSLSTGFVLPAGVVLIAQFQQVRGHVLSIYPRGPGVYTGRPSRTARVLWWGVTTGTPKFFAYSGGWGVAPLALVLKPFRTERGQGLFPNKALSLYPSHLCAVGGAGRFPVTPCVLVDAHTVVRGEVGGLG